MDPTELIPGTLYVLRVAAVNDLNVYFWVEYERVTVIDTGLPGMGDDIAAALGSLGLDRGAVRRVVLTHGHQDHAGSAAELAAWGARILVHRADAAAVRGEFPVPPPRLRDWEQPIWAALPASATAAAPASRVDRELDDGDVIDFGGGAHVIALPGHTDGSIALHLPAHRVLFAGDTVAHVGGRVMTGAFNVDNDAVERHARALARLDDVELVCVGHGTALTGAALRAALAA
jgi:glyoxylase-like metal-dependent hydrolase (beta-lactamase superfamily II)